MLQASAAIAKAIPMMKGRDSFAGVESAGKELVSGFEKELIKVEVASDGAGVLMP